MPPALPGYYFDEEKGKYFKIEKSHTAPSSAAWSAQSVKKRKEVRDVADAAEKRKRVLRNHIRRNGAFRGDAVFKGILERELGARGWTEGEGVLRSATWTAGVERKGEVPFAPSYARERRVGMPCFWVGGAGVAYASLDGETLVGSQIPLDANGRVSYSRTRDRGFQYRSELIRCRQMSSIKYHESSHVILVTSREVDSTAGIYHFSPPLSNPGDVSSQWLLGQTNSYQRLSLQHRLANRWVVNGCTPGPSSDPQTLCILGTSAGLIHVSVTDVMTWVSAPPEQSPNVPSPSGPGGKSNRPQLPREILAQDFQTGNPKVLFAGGRQPRLWRVDMRAPQREWDFARVDTTISHLKSVNEWGVVVAGPKNMMSLYDARNSSRPIMRFPSYKNAAHIHTGFDVEPSLGIAAAAQDDGSVALFSLISGRKLPCRALRDWRVDGPARSLMFAKMDGERWPSLWVGEGEALKKFSFGAQELDHEA